ncbi:hypothetical protein DXN70_12185 [Salmonella enterica]|nr:hypothetical protein [Salmonella enterica]ECV3432447.1 hypothetical protein [Salmonella enterica subsp. enterica serovar Uganda]
MEWLLLLILAVFILFLMAASNGDQPIWMSCRKMRNRYGTPKRKGSRLPGGGYQSVKSEGKTGKFLPPPKRP